MKINRTLDDYKRAGAWMRLLKSVESRAFTECSKVLRKSDADKFHVVSDRISVISSRAEDNMFDDFPELNNDYLDVFYGDAGTGPFRTRVDSEQIELMIELVKELFKDNWK